MPLWGVIRRALLAWPMMWVQSFRLRLANAFADRRYIPLGNELLNLVVGRWQ
jgi:hypothetical protein